MLRNWSLSQLGAGCTLNIDLMTIGNPALRTTRSGLATCIGPDGTLQWGPHNLYSESSVLVTQNVTVPAGSHIVSFSGTGTVTLSGAATGTIVGTGAANRVFLLVTTTAATLTSTVSGSVTSAQLENVTGTNRTTPSDYVDSTVKNRLGYSNDFANAAWTKTNSTPYPATTTQSDGTPATLLCDNATAGLHFARQDVAVTAGSWAVQIRAKQASLGFLWISMDGGSNTTWFNLATGAVGTNNTGTPTMVLGSDGFYTCQLVRTLGAVTAAIFYGVSAADAVASYAGTGQGVYIANACLVPGTGAANYSYNAAAAPAVGAYYGQRTDYDPVTLACKGALIEAQATNLLLNSAVPATQNITTTAQAYTVSMWGTGTCTLSGTATGVLTGTGANVRTSLTVTATAGTLTATFAGSNTNGQFEAGSLTSYIPTGAGAVVRVADTSSVGYDDLAKALPWLMDANIIPAANVESFDTWTKTAGGTASLPVVTANDTTYAAPDGTFTADKVVFNVGAGTTAANESSIDSSSIVTVTGAAYTGSFRVMGSAGTQLMLRHVGGNTYGLITCSGLGIWDEVPGRTEIAGTTSSTMSIGIRQGIVGTINSTATVWLWGAKLNPGPVAQTYYPQSSKQGTIVFEGDLTYGAASGAQVLASLENGASNRVLIFKNSATSQLFGYVNANGATPGNIAPGQVFKTAIGFGPSSAGVALNGSGESAITATSFAAAPNVLKIGNDANGSAASSMHIRRLRIFSQNLPASTKQALTR